MSPIANPQYVTLVANVVSTVTLDGYSRYVRVESVDGAAVVFFTVDGTTAVTTPTNGQYHVSAVAGAKRTVNTANMTDAPAVQLKSTGTPQVAVYAVNEAAQLTY